MSDEDAIQQLICCYTEGCNRRDWQQVTGTFMPDGAWEIPETGARHVGRAAIGAEMAGFVKRLDTFVQFNAPAIIAVHGDHATARSLIREAGRYAGKPQALQVMGFYDDQLVRTAKGWRFARRAFHALGLHKYPVSMAPPPPDTGHIPNPA